MKWALYQISPDIVDLFCRAESGSGSGASRTRNSTR